MWDTATSATSVWLDSTLQLGDGAYEALHLLRGECFSQNDFLHGLGRSSFQKEGPAMTGLAGPGAMALSIEQSAVPVMSFPPPC